MIFDTAFWSTRCRSSLLASLTPAPSTPMNPRSFSKNLKNLPTSFPPIPHYHPLSSSLFLSTTSQQLHSHLPPGNHQSLNPRHQVRCSSSFTFPPQQLTWGSQLKCKTNQPPFCISGEFSTDSRSRSVIARRVRAADTWFPYHTWLLQVCYVWHCNLFNGEFTHSKSSIRTWDKSNLTIARLSRCRYHMPHFCLYNYSAYDWQVNQDRRPHGLLSHQVIWVLTSDKTSFLKGDLYCRGSQTFAATLDWNLQDFQKVRTLVVPWVS